MTQKDLADAVSESYNTLRSWIKQDRYPNANQAVHIAKALHTTVEYLVSGTHERIENSNATVIALLEEAIQKLR